MPNQNRYYNRVSLTRYAKLLGFKVPVYMDIPTFYGVVDVDSYGGKLTDNSYESQAGRCYDVLAAFRLVVLKAGGVLNVQEFFADVIFNGDYTRTLKFEASLSDNGDGQFITISTKE